MFLLVPAHPGFPGQIPQSRKTVVCCVYRAPICRDVPNEAITFNSGMWNDIAKVITCIRFCVSWDFSVLAPAIFTMCKIGLAGHSENNISATVPCYTVTLQQP